MYIMVRCPNLAWVYWTCKLVLGLFCDDEMGLYLSLMVQNG